jgi:diguanylate cyclase (GGDEF)-like protein/PAS domain S-box-containing protein
VIPPVSVDPSICLTSQRISSLQLRFLGLLAEGVFGVDIQGHCTFLNPAALHMLGYQQQAELLGKHMHSFVRHDHSDNRDCSIGECRLCAASQSRKTAHIDAEVFRRRDGTSFPVEIWSNPVVIGGETVSTLITFIDISERKFLEDELKRRAQVDLLTGMNNRRQFFELAEKELARTKRHGIPTSVLMMDVDHFKSVNDTYGHHVGDRVLQKLSKVCTRTLREIDIPGRIGGEEFAILLPGTQYQQALDAGERLRLAVADTAVPVEHSHAINLSVSIGVAQFGARDGSLEDMLKRADAALYAAKKAGRNRVCCEIEHIQVNPCATGQDKRNGSIHHFCVGWQPVNSR